MSHRPSHLAEPGRGRSIRLAGLAILAAVGLLAASCGDSGDTAGSDDGPRVLATTGIWADVVSNVACGDLARVEAIIPSGGDPHSFEPSLADRERMDDADLIVANGLLLEEGLVDTLDAAADAGTPIFAVADHMETIAYSSQDDHDEEAVHGEQEAVHGEEDHEGEHAEDEDHDEHDHEGDDPHVWFDPRRVDSVLPELAEHLVDDAGLDADAVAACVEDYRERLMDLDAEIEALVAGVPEADRLLITNHDALGYFADRYGFEIIGTVIPTPSGLAETNPAQLEELAQLIESTGVGAVFAESQQSTADADALADRVGDVEVVTLFTGSLGDDGSGAETYLDLLRINAELIASALG
jgi:zinc/manganese transport system substrate-binding protein